MTTKFPPAPVAAGTRLGYLEVVQDLGLSHPQDEVAVKGMPCKSARGVNPECLYRVLLVRCACGKAELMTSRYFWSLAKATKLGIARQTEYYCIHALSRDWMDSSLTENWTSWVSAGLPSLGKRR